MEGLDVTMKTIQSVPIIDDSLAHIIARVVKVHEADDHQLYIAEVLEPVETGQGRPLLFLSADENLLCCFYGLTSRNQPSGRNSCD